MKYKKGDIIAVIDNKIDDKHFSFVSTNAIGIITLVMPDGVWADWEPEYSRNVYNCISTWWVKHECIVKIGEL